MTAQLVRSVREETRALKRDMILKAARDLFYEKGYGSTSLDEIAAALSVTKPFIYYHFEKKIDILFALHSDPIESSLQCLKDAVRRNASPKEQLRDFAQSFTKLVIHKQKEVAISSREKSLMPPEFQQELRGVKREFNRLLRKLLEEGVKRREFQIDDVETAALAITGMISWISSWYVPGGRRQPDEIAHNMEPLVLAVVRASN